MAVPDAGADVGSHTLTMLGAVIAHSQANFSEIHSCLDLLLYYLGLDYKLAPLDNPSFLEGRVGRILCNGEVWGYSERYTRRSLSIGRQVHHLPLSNST